MLIRLVKQLGPEWAAAIALLVQVVILVIQAVIFNRQTRVLGRHATTMEEHKDIVTKQAETARLIGAAMENQGTILGGQSKILGEQTKIMEKQFELQRRAEEKSEKEEAYNLVLEVNTQLLGVASALGCLPGSIFNEHERIYVQERYTALTLATSRCYRALLMALHLSSEKKYFEGYCRDVVQLEYTGKIDDDLKNVKEVQAKYPSHVWFSNMINLFLTAKAKDTK